MIRPIQILVHDLIPEISIIQVAAILLVHFCIMGGVGGKGVCKFVFRILKPNNIEIERLKEIIHEEWEKNDPGL